MKYSRAMGHVSVAFVFYVSEIVFVITKSYDVCRVRKLYLYIEISFSPMK
jgi:hypothetical protein